LDSIAVRKDFANPCSTIQPPPPRSYRGLGAELVLGEYFPTPKNDVVADLHFRLGFSAVEGSFFARTIDGGAEDFVTYVAASA
jgi:hypothetical protein